MQVEEDDVDRAAGRGAVALVLALERGEQLRDVPAVVTTVTSGASASMAASPRRTGTWSSTAATRTGPSASLPRTIGGSSCRVRVPVVRGAGGTGRRQACQPAGRPGVRRAAVGDK